ncbi:40469_t:CDS:2 [Gigaspora margarita]|uniref:40469_t:CDS:1 n=1 Tax=Gigaspora margarita TaxID=4874 RepID=A0ABN7UUQ9_GIGMA|nr:40469_t:CDS:2 [Gigaspora margarita]
MTKDKWEEYSGDLERYLKNRPSINLLLEKYIICSEEKHLSQKAQKRSPKQSKQNLQITQMPIQNTKLASLSVDIVADFNRQVREINEKNGLEIMLSSDFLAEDSLAKIKGWWFILNKHWAAEIEKEKTKYIEDLVNQQCAMIKNEQERMIQSLLEKPFCKVSIDRVLSNVNGEFLLSMDPKEVLTKTEAHF